MRFGLGWRRELGASILMNLDRIEIVEVLAEEFFDATRKVREALRFLSRQVPVTLHGTSLGLASSEPVDEKRLSAVARVVEWLQPETWSEHLAFVRGGGVEIGHLAAPPRNETTLAGLERNIRRAEAVVGRLPLLENVASLIEPPLSVYPESDWLLHVRQRTRCRILLDLHNIHANGRNFGFDAATAVRGLPPEAIGAIHLAGGRVIERGRILDDHLHAVPEPVYELLSIAAHRDVDVILERDGNYPPIDELLAEIDRARLCSSSRELIPA